MGCPLTFVLDPLGGVLVWGWSSLIGADLAAALLGTALNAFSRTAGHDQPPYHRYSSAPDHNFREGS